MVLLRPILIWDLTVHYGLNVISVLTSSWSSGICGDGNMATVVSVATEQHCHRHVCEVDEAQLCGPNLPVGPIAHILWVGASQGWKIPCLEGFNRILDLLIRIRQCWPLCPSSWYEKVFDYGDHVARLSPQNKRTSKKKKKKKSRDNLGHPMIPLPRLIFDGTFIWMWFSLSM